jgi:hypothetical protein
MVDDLLERVFSGKSIEQSLLLWKPDFFPLVP